MGFVDIPASHGRLEGLLWKCESPLAAALVCHPHPVHGGTMHNHVTYRVANAFRDAGVSTLRFNFRGVGRSTGKYDEGRGEVDDARDALDFLEREVPGAPLIVAGFSFGSRVALRLSADPRIGRVMAVGMALDLFDFEFAQAVRKPKAVLHADHDEYAPLAKVEAFVEHMPPPRKLFVVEDSDHLATGRLDAFEAVAKQAVAWLLSQPALTG